MNISNNIPKHIAIILDGNGRWALKKGKPRVYGHRHGAYNLIEIIKSASELGVKCLTFFCFSTENWTRPQSEVEYLMTKPIKYLQKYMNKLDEYDYKISMIGRRDRINSTLLSLIEKVENKTINNTGVHLVFAIDYGSLDELTHAVKNIASDVKDNKLSINDITKDLIMNNLFTKDLPPLDLMIRTSGEQRISNFLLLQMAYSELYFTECLWPDFNKEELLKAISSYQSRTRRFGGLKEDLK